MRVSDGAFSVRETGAGTAHYHRLADGSGARRNGYTHPSHKRPARPSTPDASPDQPARDWGALAAESTKGAAGRLRLLSLSLGVPAAALRDLGIGWAKLPAGCWTCPERDGAGQVIGINRRYSSGRKRAMTGGRRGLTYSTDWPERPGPLLLVEGMTDTAALWACGLAVVGRPSNTGGVDLLAELLADHAEREVVVVGERDHNPEKPKRGWPGRSGAIVTAQGLADRLGRPVSWSMVPDGHKDARDWYRASGGHPGDVVAFLDHLRQSATICQPAERPVVEPYAEPAGPLVELTSWRASMVDARLASLGVAGLYLDRSPTGAGKSHADREAMRGAGRSLTLLPDHSNCQELADALQADGHDAVAYPAITPETCLNHDEASAALGAGLSVSDAVCWGCPYRDDCEYREGMADASVAPHAIATHRRGAMNMLGLAEGRPLVLVHEDPTDLLRPTHSASPDDLDRLAESLAAGRAHELSTTSPDPDVYRWLAALSDTTTWLLDQVDRAATTTPLTSPIRHRPPSHWQGRLWRSLRGAGAVLPPGDALRLVVALVSGDVVSAAVQVDLPKAAGGQPTPVKTVVVVTQTALPSRSTIWFADATMTSETLETLAGRPVLDMTPHGRLPHRTEALQIPSDVTRQASLGTVAGILAGLLASRPDARQVGLIGHRPHIRGLAGRRSPLAKADRERITRTAYYGQGPDRASNGWLDCDLLVVLGTPRLAPAAIRRELIRRGHLAAASDPDEGRWGPRHWEGRTTSGEPITVEGRGYADPEWAAVQRDMVGAALRQAVGRGRAVLADGVPTVVASTEPLDLPILAEDRAVNAPPQVRQAAEVVKRHCSGSPKVIVLGEPEQWRGIGTTEVAAVLGVSKATASEHLSAAAAAGLVTRSPSRKGGWLPAGTLSPPDDASPAGAAGPPGRAVDPSVSDSATT